MRKILLAPSILSIASLCLALPSAHAAVQPSGDTVSRQEYDELKSQFLALKKQMDRLESHQSTAPSGKSADRVVMSSSGAASLASLQSDVETLKKQVDDNRPGTTNFHLTGNASASFSALDNTNSNFTATFSPIFLWTLSDKLFFESEVEFELEGSDTVTKLEYAQLAYFLNDYMTIGVGKFLAPSNVFVERYEGKWINKFPDTPLAVYDGILPESIVGAQVRGSIPIGPSKLLYAFYAGNGPKLDSASGSLIFDNFSDTKNAKAVGGRVAIMPVHGLEVGYAFQYSKVGDSGSTYSGVKSVLQSVDFDWTASSPMLRGTVDLRGQYAWSKTDNAEYDGLAAFDNKRDGGYIQASYRPSRVDNDVLKKLELAVRYDVLNLPDGSPEADKEKRLSIGLDYWLTSSTVLKAAYEEDHRDLAPDQSGVIVQMATGF